MCTIKGHFMHILIETRTRNIANIKTTILSKKAAKYIRILRNSAEVGHRHVLVGLVPGSGKNDFWALL
jgi:hypothetical protein